ncbi:MAG: phospho-sugar mutase, partial [Ruthenibacterium sp.]
ILLLEKAGEESRFLFGFEESYGYLAGTYVRDKDAVVTSMLICEMAAYYKSIGSSILQQLAAIYKKFGRYLHKVDSFEFDGLSGMDNMKRIMSNLRADPLAKIADYAVVKTADYETHVIQELATGAQTTIDLPAADVLTYWLSNGACVIVRPSGTEPKIKIYYSTKGADLAEAEAVQKQLSAAMQPLLG